jgi:hypothetical protein
MVGTKYNNLKYRMPPKKIIDYTQQGKPLSQEYRSNLKRCGSNTLSNSSACSLLEQPPPACCIANRGQQQGGSQESLDTSFEDRDSNNLGSTLVLLITATEAASHQQEESGGIPAREQQEDEESTIEFMLRIPSGTERRRRRSDLRERFPRNRPIIRLPRSTSVIVKSPPLKDIALTTTRGRTKKHRGASF